MLAVHEAFRTKKQEIDERFDTMEREQIIATSLTIAQGVNTMIGSFGNLAAVQTANAVKRAQTEGKSEEQIQAIRKKGFERQKKFMLLSAIINTASGVARAFTDHVFPLSAVVAGLVGAAGAAQVATISQQQFAKGFEGNISEPTSIMVGEEGAEHVSITHRSQVGKASNSSGGSTTIIIQGDINGEEQFIDRIRSANEEIERRSA